MGVILKLLAINPLSIIPIHWISENSEMIGLPQNLHQDFSSAIWFGLLIAGLFAIILQARLFTIRKK
jgi:hypothetical protein